MIDVDKIIRAAIQKGASDIHLVTGQHPMFRISKALIPYEEVWFQGWLHSGGADRGHRHPGHSGWRCRSRLFRLHQEGQRGRRLCAAGRHQDRCCV